MPPIDKEAEEYILERIKNIKGAILIMEQDQLDSMMIQAFNHGRSFQTGYTDAMLGFSKREKENFKGDLEGYYDLYLEGYDEGLLKKSMRETQVSA